jgi:uncharacterized membrane protein
MSKRVVHDILSSCYTKLRREITMIKKFGLIAIVALMLTSVLALVASAADVPVTIDTLKINGDEVFAGERLALERGDTITVRTVFTANADDNVQFEIEIDGYDYDDLSEETERFRIISGDRYTKQLSLTVPSNIDVDDQYTLRVRITNRNDDPVETQVPLEFTGRRHDVVLEDVVFHPGTTVQAGRSLLTVVRLDNQGDEDQDDIKIQVSLPKLGITDVDFMDELESDERKSSEELFVRIPECTAPGEYTARVDVEYDERTRTVSDEFLITVLENPRCKQAEDRTVITVGPESQNIVAGGAEAIFPVALTNAGSNSRTYTISANTGTWASSRVSSSVLVVGAGETKVASVYVAANSDAPQGKQLVNLAVRSGDKTLKEVALTANVVEANNDGSVKRGLEIGLVVLVVLLVIVGLIVGLSRLKGNDLDGKDDETYY